MTENISKLLLPRERYSEEIRKFDNKSFTFELSAHEQNLFYFAANHSPDPNNEQYRAIKDYWHRFITKTEKEEKIVLVEMWKRQIAQDEESAIKTGQEGDLVTLYAHRENIPTDSTDLTKEEYLNSNPEIDREPFLLHSFLSWVDQFQKIANPKPDFEASLLNWCNHNSQRRIWKDQQMDVSPEGLRFLYKKLISKEFNENQSQNYIIDPNKTDTIINTTLRKYSDLREIKIVEGIEKYWKEGKSIFVVFGSGHLIIQKPALEQILK